MKTATVPLPEPPSSWPQAIFPGSGDMAGLMSRHDWSSTALGDPANWPTSLKTVVRIMLTSRYAMWMGWGPDLIFFYNDAYRPTLGVKHGWALGTPASQVWAEVWPAVSPLVEGVMSTGVASWNEDLLLFLERSGVPEETYHTFSYSPLMDDEGRTAGMFCVVMEDTKRVISERRMTTLRELASALASTKVEEETWVAMGRCIGANRRDMPFTLTYLQERSGEGLRLVSATGFDGGHEAAPPWIESGIPAAWPLGGFPAGEPWRKVTDLSSRFEALPMGEWDIPPREALIVPIKTQGQAEPAGFFISALNPYRPFDQDLAAFLELVANQVAAGIANARAYEETRKRAEALVQIDRAKTAFFSNVSHEFRTPLTLMLGPLEEALADQALPPHELERLHLMHRSGTRLLKLVNTLLDFSRIEAGRVQASFVRTDLAAFTAELASCFRSATERVGIELRVDCPHIAAAVYVDRDLWEKVVLNLLSNAFKFTFEGHIAVSVRAVGGVARMAVSDTGVGIPAEELPKMFERFHRIEGARGRSYEGSGIGLALVQELVGLHGGTIAVESREGQGSTFTVDIPLGKAHLPPMQVREGEDPFRVSATAGHLSEVLSWMPEGEDAFVAATGASCPAPAEAQAHPASGQGARVLLADDNADMRGYVSRLLGDRYRCEAVSDGLAALDAARRERPDLVVTDIMMPRLDGFGLIKALRQDAELCDLPIIALSARAGEEASIEGLSMGADDYVAKPFSARELLARVDGALAIARIRREAKEAQRAINESLERRVADMLAQHERSEAQLRQAQKMEAVGKLTGGVAHDFNNLLQVIGGNLQLLGREVAGHQRAELCLANALAGVARGAKLASHLLAFGRKQPLAPKVLNLARLIEGTDDMLRQALGEAVEIGIVIGAQLWNTFADAGQVENALLNLAINARDAMQGGGRLTIELANATLDGQEGGTHDEVAPGQYVMLAVSDTGCGMPRDVLDRVFEPFFTTKPEGHGTGLGLSMVYGFARQSGGHIKVDSEPGLGTTVRMYLPRSHDQEDSVPEADSSPVTGGTETILVVEDDDSVRATVVEMLSELGYQVLTARDAASALVLVESGMPIDVLFTDVVMPGPLKSPELARLAKAHRPDIAVLFTSGYAENAIVHGGRLDDGVDLLGKPYTREALARKLRHTIGNHQQQRMEGLAVAPTSLQAQGQAADDLPAQRILLVEDDEGIRQATAMILDMMGHEVVAVGEAREAQSWLDAHQADVLVTDISLNGMSGTQLVEEVRQRLPHLPVVFVSGYEPDQVALPSRAVFLRKPYEMEELTAALRQAVELSG